MADEEPAALVQEKKLVSDPKVGQKQAEEICNECSRHRDNEPINNTPE